MSMRATKSTARKEERKYQWRKCHAAIVRDANHSTANISTAMSVPQMSATQITGPQGVWLPYTQVSSHRPLYIYFPKTVLHRISCTHFRPLCDIDWSILYHSVSLCLLLSLRVPWSTKYTSCDARCDGRYHTQAVSMAADECLRVGIYMQAKASH